MSFLNILHYIYISFGFFTFLDLLDYYRHSLIISCQSRLKKIYLLTTLYLIVEFTSVVILSTVCVSFIYLFSYFLPFLFQRLIHVSKALRDQQWLLENLMARVEEKRTVVENTAKQIQGR